MYIYIINHRPLNSIRLKECLSKLYISEVNIDSCLSTKYADHNCIIKADWLLVNPELFTFDFKQQIDKLRNDYPNYHIIGLVDEENIDILRYIIPGFFDALVMEYSLFDELSSILESFEYNKRYFSSHVIEIFNNLKEGKSKEINYE